MPTLVISTPDQAHRIVEATSRNAVLANLEPGECLYLEAPRGASLLMRQLQSQFQRLGLTGRIRMSHVQGIETSTRTVIDLVRIQRKANNEPDEPEDLSR